MSELTAKERKALKTKEFALPKERKYPTDTKARGVSALGRAKQHATPAQQKAIKKNVCGKYDLPSCKQKTGKGRT